MLYRILIFNLHNFLEGKFKRKVIGMAPLKSWLVHVSTNFITKPFINCRQKNFYGSTLTTTTQLKQWSRLGFNSWTNMNTHNRVHHSKWYTDTFFRQFFGRVYHCPLLVYTSHTSISLQVLSSFFLLAKSRQYHFKNLVNSNDANNNRYT